MSDDERRTTSSDFRSQSADRQEVAISRPHSRSGEGKRSRSRSPPREDRREKKPKRKDAGFKWKEQRRDDEDAPRDRGEGLRRGYKDHYKPRERSRSRERQRSRSPRRRDYGREDRDNGREDRDNGRDRGGDRHRDGSHRDRRNQDDRPRRADRDRDRPDRDGKPKPEKKAPPPAPSMPQQEMILVTVNDRLGTKKQVPCLPSDTVKDFKAVVAMMIGRRPHEILLKRQSERPFKDFLTLQDYGVSNNVQLDLEVDTGD